MRPEDYFYSCPKDLFFVAKGYQERVRMDWHRSAMLVKALGGDVDVDAIFGKKPTRHKVRGREDFAEFIKRFPSHRKEQDGRTVSDSSGSI